MCFHIKNLQLIFPYTDFRPEILRKLNIILHKVNMMDRRLEVVEEQGRDILLERREENINILHDEEMGLLLRDEFALNILEGKLKDKDFYRSMVCYFRTLFFILNL